MILISKVPLRKIWLFIISLAFFCSFILISVVIALLRVLSLPRNMILIVVGYFSSLIVQSRLTILLCYCLMPFMLVFGSSLQKMCCCYYVSCSSQTKIRLRAFCHFVASSSFYLLPFCFR